MTPKTEHKVNQRLEQAAKETDRGTRPGRERSARLVTQANALKRGRTIPAYAKNK